MAKFDHTQRFPKVKTIYYQKPFNECKEAFESKWLKVSKHLKAGVNSVYIATKDGKEIDAYGFNSESEVIRYYGGR